MLPALGPAFGIDVTGDLVREAGEGIVQTVQAVGGLARHDHDDLRTRARHEAARAAQHATEAVTRARIHDEFRRRNLREQECQCSPAHAPNHLLARCLRRRAASRRRDGCLHRRLVDRRAHRASQGLTTVEALSRIAATEIPGVIVKTTLCEENGALRLPHPRARCAAAS